MKVILVESQAKENEDVVKDENIEDLSINWARRRSFYHELLVPERYVNVSVSSGVANNHIVL